MATSLWAQHLAHDLGVGARRQLQGGEGASHTATTTPTTMRSPRSQPTTPIIATTAVWAPGVRREKPAGPRVRHCSAQRKPGGWLPNPCRQAGGYRAPRPAGRCWHGTSIRLRLRLHRRRQRRRHRGKSHLGSILSRWRPTSRDSEDSPFVGHTLQDVAAAILEGQARTNNEVFDGPGDQHLPALRQR